MTAFYRIGFIVGPVFAISRKIRYVAIGRPCNYRSGHDYFGSSGLATLSTGKGCCNLTELLCARRYEPAIIYHRRRRWRDHRRDRIFRARLIASSLQRKSRFVLRTVRSRVVVVFFLRTTVRIKHIEGMSDELALRQRLSLRRSRHSQCDVRQTKQTKGMQGFFQI